MAFLQALANAVLWMLRLALYVALITVGFAVALLTSILFGGL